MGSKASVPKISQDFIRQHRNIFGEGKANPEALLQSDGQIQRAYREWGGRKTGISQVNTETGGEIIEYEPEFKQRYFDVETVKKVVFTPINKPDQDEDLNKILDESMMVDTFPFKLYICEPLDAVKQNFNKMGKAVHVAVKNKFVGLFGLAHAALQIADKIVHFVDNHFVKIDSFKAGSALLLTKISTSGRLPKTNEVMTLIAEVIVDWNKNAMYDQAKLNCQDFVEDMCRQLNSKIKSLDNTQKLDLEMTENPILREYLDNLVTHPDKSGFHITYNGELVEFTSHKQLDQWEAAHPDLSDQQKEFLKGFHRAFQLRHNAAVKTGDVVKIELYEDDPYSGCVRGGATII